MATTTKKKWFTRVAPRPTLPLRTLLATAFRRRPDPHCEHLAASWLRLHGLRLLEQNYSCPHGEVDLIMRHGQTIVYVEVKYRSQRGCALLAINTSKQKRIARTASVFQSRNPRLAHCPMRFDAVTIEWPKPSRLPTIRWYPAVFENTA